LIALALWLVLVFHSRLTWWLAVAPFAPLVAMESLRSYIFVGLALVIPVSIAIVPRIQLRDRALTTAAAVVVALVFLTVHFTRLGPPVLAGFAGLEPQRLGMGVVPNTSYASVRV